MALFMPPTIHYWAGTYRCRADPELHLCSQGSLGRSLTLRSCCTAKAILCSSDETAPEGSSPISMPHPARHGRHERLQPRRREGERALLLGALVGRHQQLDDLHAVVEGELRFFEAEEGADEVAVPRPLAVGGPPPRGPRAPARLRGFLFPPGPPPRAPGPPAEEK